MGLKFARDNSASGHRDDNTNDSTALEIYRAAALCKFQSRALGAALERGFVLISVSRAPLRLALDNRYAARKRAKAYVADKSSLYSAAVVRLMLGGHLAAFSSASDRPRLVFRGRLAV